jgi:hypothetical protein
MRAVQPNASNFETSSTLRGMPSGFEVSNSFPDRAVDAGPDVHVPGVGVVVQEVEARIGEVVDVEELATW